MKSDEERLAEFEEREARTTRFKTHEEFLEFSKDNFVYYPHGFGYQIQALVNNEPQFKDFIQKCCLEPQYNMWLADLFENEYITFNPTEEDTGYSHESYFDAELVEYEFTPLPTKELVGYEVDVNPYFEDGPIAVTQETIKIYENDRLVIKPEVLEKLPALVRFYSVDDFDRLGSIKGDKLEIISLKDLHNGLISLA